VTETDFDVIVAGAGMVGASLAGLLGRSGLRVAVVEPQSQGAEKDLAQRVVAVTPASVNILQAAGIWQRLAPEQSSPYREMRVWSADGGVELHFDAADAGAPALGYIVANRAIEAAAWEQIDAMPDAHWIRPGRVESVQAESELIRVDAGNGRVQTARLLAGADGGHSRVRELAGIESRRSPYHQGALVCTVMTEKPHMQTAWQRFLPGGPLAFLPLADPHACSIVWSQPVAEAQRRLSLDQGDFLGELTAGFEGRLGEITGCGERRVFPLSRAHAASYLSDRVVLAGDAAHTVHPLAGQGVNLGLLDVASLSEVLQEAADKGRDIGTRSVLRRYERWRRGQNTLMLTLMDTINTVYSSRSDGLRGLGGSALALAQGCVPARRAMMAYAMGVRGDLPRIARVQR